jgi:hypothetical protein
LGLTGLKSRSPKGRFCCAQVDGGVYLPPLVKGGSGGVGRRTSASSVYSPFARNDVRKRHAIYGGEAAHAPSTSSFDRAKHASLVHSMLSGPPPLTPPSQGGGKKKGALAEFAQRIRQECKSCAIPTFHNPRVALADVSLPDADHRKETARARSGNYQLYGSMTEIAHLLVAIGIPNSDLLVAIGGVGESTSASGQTTNDMRPTCFSGVHSAR